MKIYFGKLYEDIDTPYNSSFIHNGNCYEYMIEYGDETLDDLVIKDSIGRYIPINIENIENLCNALMALISANEQIDAADKVLENMLNPKFAISIDQ